MQTITINNKTYPVPQSWNDLPLRSLLKCYAAIMTDTYGAIEQGESLLLKRQMLIELLWGLNGEELDQYRQTLKAEHDNDDEADTLFFSQLKTIYELLDTAFFERLDDTEDEETPPQYAIKLGLTKCPYKKIQRNGAVVISMNGKKNQKTYHAPADNLDNISIYELALTFTAFEQWVAMPTGEEKENKLNYLLALLYREAKPPTKGNRQANYGGDKRQPLLHMEAIVPQRQRKMKELEPRVKQLIAFWFASCRQQIINQNPEVFKVPTGEETQSFGFGGLLLELAGGIIHLDKVSEQPYQNAMLYLKQLEARRIEAERRSKK